MWEQQIQEEDEEPFDQKMKRLTALLKQQQEEGARLDRQIAENLREGWIWILSGDDTV